MGYASRVPRSIDSHLEDIMKSLRRLLWSIPCLALIAVPALSPSGIAAAAIVRDAEYYILEAQHGEVWAAEDKALDAKLEEFRSRNGGKLI